MKERKHYSESVIQQIRENLSADERLKDFQLSVIVTGSFGRNEASEVSDMDWFIISSDDLDINIKEEVQAIVRTVVDNFVTKNVGSTGTFGGVITKNELLTNFGGDKETNQEFTRRMLYLLESTWLFNESLYSSLKKSIVEKYIKDGVSDSNLNRFMLNDVIRYYRTICTDYEYKVHEHGKSWGVRKIKLRFSRKLLYFSGLITVASTSSLTRDLKIEQTLELLDKSPIERIEYILGTNQSSRMLKHYGTFLSEISKDEIRSSLDEIERSNRNNNANYRGLKNLSQHFNWELEKCFANEFPPSHPIHAALVF